MKIENGILVNINDSDIIDGKFIASDSVTEIGEYAFANCANLESIVIPNSVTKIGDYAFMNCNNLLSVIIPNSVINIKESAFFNCNSLLSIDIPNSVTKIDDFAFENCNDLESINVNKDNKYYSSKDGVLFNKDKTILIKYPQGKKGEKYIIPNSVTKIWNSSFSICIKLRSIIISDSVTEIGEGAFVNCSNLESIIISNSVNIIRESVFYNCDSLKSITIPYSVTEIENEAFEACKSLSSINVNDENKYYFSEDGVLFNKDKTTLIKYPEGKKDEKYIMPNSVIEIGKLAFDNCINLKSITIPNSIAKIRESAFYNCKSLHSKLGNYKAFEKGLICNDIKYTPNEWYRVDGEIELCEWGLHYVTNLFDIFNYYYGNLENDIEIWEVEAGDIIVNDEYDSKKATNAILPKHKLSKKEIIDILNN